MRHVSVFLFFILLQFTITAQVTPVKKVALIVAISKYQDTKWGQLSSKNDVQLIRESLIRQGFKEADIAVITEKQATLAGIKAAIDKELLAKIKEGDIAVFHFSGHGQQMDDNDGDEGDGLDEALVPYDAPISYTGGIEKHYRDDQLGAKLDEVRTKLGPKGDFLVIIDACHSGTSTRGLSTTRGTTQVYRTPVAVIKKSKRTNNDAGFGITDDGSNLAPMACFFASAPSEQNQEASLPNGTNYGSLSLAFSRALSKSDKDSSYRSLFESIKIEMSSLVSRQTPMAEGNLDRTLFAGNALGKTTYFNVQRYDKKNPKLITVGFGKIYGIFEGTTVNLYKPDTRDTANIKPLAKGKVIFAGEYTSDIELDRSLDTSKLVASWIYLDEINYGDLGVKVKFNIKDPALKKSITDIFKNIKQATVVEGNADLYIEEGAEGLMPDTIYISDASERTIWKKAKGIESKNLSDSLVQNVGNFARAKYLRSLNLENENYKVVIEFVPVTCVSGCGTRGAKYKDGPVKTSSGDSLHIAFKVGDKFRLNIVNKSDQKRVYYTILDIQPDNKVNVLIPSNTDRAEDFFIPQQETIKLDRIYTVGPPEGMEMMKIIASDAPIDLRSMVVTRGAGTRGSKRSNPFEKLMQNTYNAENTKTRSLNSDPIKPDAVNIETISFMIGSKASK